MDLLCKSHNVKLKSDRYVAPEYAKSGNLNESSDVYSFGVLLMEIVSGRNPVEYTRPKPEVITNNY